MLQTLVLASRNSGKIRELQALLAPLGVTLRPVSDFPDVPEVEETGLTFEENARLKAEAVCEATGLPSLADDSGLAVDALGGKPGVHSARFAGPDATDADNRTELLRQLDGLPIEKRIATFHCVMAFARPGLETLFVHGTSTGTITAAEHGDSGFGYDPVFRSDDLGITFAEASAEAKNRISHRGRALQAFLGLLTGGD